jgi:hypothetical protein
VTLRGAVGAVASEPIMADAANQTLLRSASAVDACIAGWLAAAAVLPGVLLGPVHLIVAGPGAGAHAYDGSVLQPGLRAPRPRGFVSEEPIPPAARVGAASSVAAMVAAHAHHGVSSLPELASGAIKLASAAASGERAALLRRIGDAGSVALREPGFVRAMLDVGGRPVGGTLTAAALDAAHGIVGRAATGGAGLRVRDCQCEVGFELQPLILCACDVRGVLATMHCAHDPDGVQVPDVQLIAPRLAAPVRRGVTRIGPGKPLQVPTPIAILLQGDVPWAAVGMETDGEFPIEAFDPDKLCGLSIDQVLRNQLSDKVRAGLAVLRGPGGKGGLRLLKVSA